MTVEEIMAWALFKNDPRYDGQSWRFCSDRLKDMFRSDAKAALKTLTDAGYAVVPVEPTEEMRNAAIDVDSYKLGDISPLGFRESPQRLFGRCYKAMIETGAHKV